MTTPGGSRGFTDLERQSAELVEAMRLTARLLRALAPVATEMRALQEAMLSLQDATGAAVVPSALSASAPPPPARLAPPTARQTQEYVPGVPPVASDARPAGRVEPAAAVSDDEPPAIETPAAAGATTNENAGEAGDAESVATAAGRPTAISVSAEPEAVPGVRTADGPPAREPAGSTGRRRTVSVTVMRSEGPLDLVRVHSALDGLEGVTGLALASYTRGRANILLDTERDPAELDVRDALLAAFPEGVSGEWTSESEYVATIGAGSPVTG